MAEIQRARLSSGIKKKGGGRKDYTRELQLLRRLFVGFGRACCYFLAVLYLLIEMD